MRIAFDATALPPALSGAGNYIVQLAGALSRLRTVDRLVEFNGTINASDVSLVKARSGTGVGQTVDDNMQSGR